MNASSLGSAVGALISLIIIGNIAFTIIIIVALIKTYNRIKIIAGNTEKIHSHTEQTNQTLSAQYTLEHCYMNRFQPHEWYPTGNQTSNSYEFKCMKCGMIINVPKNN